MSKKYELSITGPDAEPEVPGMPEVMEISNGTTACNTYVRLGQRGNDVTLKAPNGHKIRYATTPDPWGQPLG